MAKPTEEKKPRGRDSVRAALTASATELYAKFGPAGVSVREIAKHAKVNHGLVHRHFGSKEALLVEVMNGLASQVNTALGPVREDETLAELLPLLVQDEGGVGTHWRILAQAILAGEDPAELQKDFPVFQRLIAAARNSLGPDVHAEVVATFLVSTGLGMMLFNPFFQAASGQSDADWLETRVGVYRLVLKSLSASGAPKAP
jgi:AcrR family transcriptional regulator